MTSENRADREVEATVECGRCQGDGGWWPDQEAEWTECPACGGKGRIDARSDRMEKLCRANGVQFWRYAEAPAWMRRAAWERGGEEFLLYVPPESLDATGDLAADEPLLAFLNDMPKRPDLSRHAGDEWGLYVMVEATGGGRIAVTSSDFGVPK